MQARKTDKQRNKSRIQKRKIDMVTKYICEDRTIQSNRRQTYYHCIQHERKKKKHLFLSFLAFIALDLDHYCITRRY